MTENDKGALVAVNNNSLYQCLYWAALFQWAHWAQEVKDSWLVYRSSSRLLLQDMHGQICSIAQYWDIYYLLKFLLHFACRRSNYVGLRVAPGSYDDAMHYWVDLVTYTMVNPSHTRASHCQNTTPGAKSVKTPWSWRYESCPKNYFWMIHSACCCSGEETRLDENEGLGWSINLNASITMDMWPSDNCTLTCIN